jgi:hypothetical protein
MTTATAETGRKHELPCFCDTCLPTTVYDQLDERAKLLRDALDDRLYTDGFERVLAETLIDAIPAAGRPRVLEFMLEWEHLMPRVMAVDCLLDECDTRSYEALSEMSRILLAEIYAQDAAPRALRLLVTKEICELERLIGLKAAA